MIPSPSFFSPTGRRRPHCTFFLCALCAVLVSACGGRSGYFKVSGRLANIDQGEFYIYSPDGAIDGIDTIHVTGGRFTYERPCEREALLLMVFPNFSEQPIFAEPGEKVSVKGDVSHLRDIEIEGTKANNLMTKFRKQTLSSLPQQAREAAARTIADHPESPVGVYLVRRYFLRPPAVDYGQAASLIDLMMDKQPRNGSLQRLKKQVDQLAKGIEKSPLPSFSVTDDKGATLSSGNLSKGLTAISVWSSWNFESQDQQRRLRRIMRSSGGRLNVVSISVDANRKEVERILQRDSIQWQNVTADRLFESPLLLQLGVSNVPDIIVVRDGRIIDRSVTMANLQEKFDQLLR